jgi:hypothetical protein
LLKTIGSVSARTQQISFNANSQTVRIIIKLF